MNDIELLALLRTDPERGLAQTVSRYSAFVYKIASARLRYVCTREDIEEAVSDTFYIFFTNGQNNGFIIRSVRAILSVIAKRHCINVFHRHSRQPKTVNLYAHEIQSAEAAASAAVAAMLDSSLSSGAEAK
ncbi:MAG: hypothetical protein K6B74_00645 [Ruminococcus sp.]|nr:hypothetical protein [Ruminococcus sp.]